MSTITETTIDDGEKGFNSVSYEMASEIHTDASAGQKHYIDQMEDGRWAICLVDIDGHISLEAATQLSRELDDLVMAAQNLTTYGCVKAPRSAHSEPRELRRPASADEALQRLVD